jgi:hypothetical protein
MGEVKNFNEMASVAVGISCMGPLGVKQGHLALSYTVTRIDVNFSVPRPDVVD